MFNLCNLLRRTSKPKVKVKCFSPQSSIFNWSTPNPQNHEVLRSSPNRSRSPIPSPDSGSQGRRRRVRGIPCENSGCRETFLTRSLRDVHQDRHCRYNAQAQVCVNKSYYIMMMTIFSLISINMWLSPSININWMNYCDSQSIRVTTLRFLKIPLRTHFHFH